MYVTAAANLLCQQSRVGGGGGSNKMASKIRLKLNFTAVFNGHAYAIRHFAIIISTISL